MDELSEYRQPVQDELSEYRQPVQDELSEYRQPVQDELSEYGQPVQDELPVLRHSSFNFVIACKWLSSKEQVRYRVLI